VWLFDPSAGDVRAVDVGHGVIDKYAANGEYVGQVILVKPPGGLILQLFGVE
jgi:hypothetical protein